MSDLIIEAGRFYKTQNGWKAEVLKKVEGFELYVGYVITYPGSDGGPNIITQKWDENGKSPYCGESVNLIALWIDPPVVDWSRFPAHIVAVAMQLHGDWRAYMSIPKPAKGYGEWEVELRSFEEVFDITDESIIPVFSGDWRDSLAVRPGWEEK